MTHRITVLALALCLCGLPGLALADAPDTGTPARVVEYVDHVCVSKKRIQCKELDQTQLGFTGCECTKNPGACSANPDSVPAMKRRCRIDYVPGATIQVNATAIADDLPTNNDAITPKLVVTVLLEGPPVRWGQKLVVAESYIANGAGVGVGGWNTFANEDEVLMIMDDSLGMIPVKSQLAIQDALVAFFFKKTGEVCVPLLTDVRPHRPDLATDQSPNGADTDLATVARYRAKLRCARGDLPTD